MLITTIKKTGRKRKKSFLLTLKKRTGMLKVKDKDKKYHFLMIEVCKVNHKKKSFVE